MKEIIIGITIISGVIFIVLLIYGIVDSMDGDNLPPDGTTINYESDEIFMENDFIDEYSPEGLNLDDFDRTLRILKLKNKLDKIEEKREIIVGTDNPLPMKDLTFNNLKKKIKIIPKS